MERVVTRVIMGIIVISIVVGVASRRYLSNWKYCHSMASVDAIVGKKGGFSYSGHIQILNEASLKARYGVKATRKLERFSAIVVHSTVNDNIDKLIAYGQSRDRRRKGSYGYHFYIDKDGTIKLGAPLSKRTNHVLPPGHKHRRKNKWSWISNSNSIGVTVVGALRVEYEEVEVVRRKKKKIIKRPIISESMTLRQLDALMAIVTMLYRKYNIKTGNIVGHGELQKTRYSLEGKYAAYIRKYPTICHN